MKSKIPLCFYPTQVIFVDDNSDFLKTLSLALAKKFKIRTFTNCTEALAFVNNFSNESASNQSLQTPLLEGETEVWVKRVLSQKQPQPLSGKQHLEPSVVVVDYSMPEMNGIEFCEKINNQNIKRILLTGFATSADAVKAFNNNTINYYLNKAEPEMLNELAESIERLQHAYFNDWSHDIKSDAIDSSTPFFSDSALADYFDELCQTLKVKEYYYLSNPSRFHLSLANGNSQTWVLYTEANYLEHLQIMLEELAPVKLIEMLKKKTHIPYFPTTDGYYDSDIIEPEKYMAPVTKIEGKVNYYVGLLDSPVVKNVASETPKTHGKLH